MKFFCVSVDFSFYIFIFIISPKFPLPYTPPPQYTNLKFINFFKPFSVFTVTVTLNNWSNKFPFPQNRNWCFPFAHLLSSPQNLKSSTSLFLIILSYLSIFGKLRMYQSSNNPPSPQTHTHKKKICSPAHKGEIFKTF